MSGIGERIRAAYSTLTPAECRIADLLLASPGHSLGFTATELAEHAGVSKPTVTRFVGKLGLDGFHEFRRLALEGLAVEPGSPLDLMARELDVTKGDLGVLVAESLRADVENLRGTYQSIDERDIDVFVDHLVHAPRVAFVDFRKNHALAAYAGTLINSIRPDVRVLPERGTSALDGLLDVTPDDVVVMFPFRRAQRDHDVVSHSVARRGATLLTIGDRYPNPATERSQVHLVCRTDGVSIFDSLVAPLSLVHLLFTATANRLGHAARQRLEMLEEEHEGFGTFVRLNHASSEPGGAV